ncbi:hypothetical protein BC829DRAFT_387030 [Chytridium lagenaria]|nr:hypothetical protein BC829DRAFT_387030 [Chytridium lagenaria]
MLSRPQILKDADMTSAWQRHYGLHKGGKLSVSYSLPEEACGKRPAYTVNMFFFNVDHFDLSTSDAHLDLNQQLGCRGSVEFEARAYGHHFVLFTATASQATATGGYIIVQGSTPTYPHPTTSITSCTPTNGTCKLTFRKLALPDRHAQILLVDTRPAIAARDVDVFPYVTVGKWYIYSTLKMVSWVIVMGLLGFSFTTCCFGISPVDAWNRIRQRTRGARAGVFVSYHAVPSGP